MASTVEEAFETAKTQFLSSARADSDDVLRFASIKEVYDVTDQIQKERSRSRTLRNLRRIEPYLDCLQHYSKVVETFVQVKPDVLALIWVRLKWNRHLL